MKNETKIFLITLSFQMLSNCVFITQANEFKNGKNLHIIAYLPEMIQCSNISAIFYLQGKKSPEIHSSAKIFTE